MKAELFVVVKPGDRGTRGNLNMVEGQPLPRLVAGVSPSEQCVLPSSCSPPASSSLHHPPPQRVSSHDAELDSRPQREALLCTVSYYGLHCWVPPAVLSADTHSGPVTHRKMSD